MTLVVVVGFGLYAADAFADRRRLVALCALAVALHLAYTA